MKKKQNEAAKRRQKLAETLYRSGKINDLIDERIEITGSPWRIVSYDRVVEPEKLPFPMRADAYVRPDVFEQHLQYYSTECNPLPLSVLLKHIEHNERLPERSVVLTFNGGHMDAYLFALPLLLKYRIPATVFLATGYLEKPTYFYEDRLAYVLTVLEHAGVSIPFVDILDPSLLEQIESISPEHLVTPETKRLLVNYLRVAAQEVRTLAMMRLVSAMGEDPSLPPYEDFMRWADVQHLTQSGIECASMGHLLDAWPQMPQAKFVADYHQSMEALEAYGITPLPVFRLSNYTLSEATLDGLRELGCRYVAVDSLFPEPRFQGQLPMKLGRVQMSQFAAPTVPLAACVLWSIESQGTRF